MESRKSHPSRQKGSPQRPASLVHGRHLKPIVQKSRLPGSGTLLMPDPVLSPKDSLLVGQLALKPKTDSMSLETKEHGGNEIESQDLRERNGSRDAASRDTASNDGGGVLSANDKGMELQEDKTRQHQEITRTISETDMTSLPEEHVRRLFQDHITAILDILTSFPKILKRLEHGNFTYEFIQGVERISEAYHELRIYPVKLMREGRLQAGAKLVDSGSLGILCDIVAEELESKNYLSSNRGVMSVSRHVLRHAVQVIWNFTDHNEKVVMAVVDHPSFLSAVLDRLKELTTAHLDGIPAENDDDIPDPYLPSSFISILHNLGLYDDSVTYLRQLQAADVTKPYLKSYDEDIRVTTTAFLANVMTDQQAALFSTSPGSLQTLLQLLEKAVGDPKHSYGGWRVTELVKAVRQLARNDENKRTLVEHGALPLLTQGLRSEFEDEKEMCMDAVWVLSFHEANVKAIAGDLTLMDLVVKLYQDKDQSKSCRRSAEGLLWQLRQELSKNERYQAMVQDFLEKSNSSGMGVSNAPASSSLKSEGHVMLSYQWGHQSVVKDICARLKSHGLKVWMDIYEMGGSTRQSMAEAVEKASVVLCCISHKYKDSPNCRQELEYACDCGKPIIPLKMQMNYRPDGWLGFIITGKLFYDFSGKYDFDTKFDELLRAVTKQIGILRNDSAVDGRTDTAKLFGAESKSNVVFRTVAHTSQAGLERVKDWSPSDVTTWLHSFGLEGEQLQELTGEELAFLHSLRSQAPEFFYRTLETKLGIQTLKGLIQFNKALDKLATADLQ